MIHMNSTLICEPSICESSSWILGVGGKCNNATGVCECPPGYSGTYILVSENDCHMSTTFRQIMGIANFGFAVVGLLASIIALVKLTREISSIYRPRIFPFFNSGEYSLSGADGRGQLRQKNILERKLLAYACVFLFFVYAVCEVIRTPALLYNHEAYAEGLPIDAAIISGIGFGASRAAFFISLYVHSSSLPKNDQLAAMLGRSFNAKRYKKVIKWVFKLNGLSCVVIHTGAYWLNTVMPPWYTLNFSIIELAVQAIMATSSLVVGCVVYYWNVPSFKKILRFCSQHKSVPKLKLAVSRCQLLVTLPPPGILFLIACIVFNSLEPRASFLAFTNVAINEMSIAILGCYVLAWDYVSIEKEGAGEGTSATVMASHTKDDRKSLRKSQNSSFLFNMGKAKAGVQQTSSHHAVQNV